MISMIANVYYYVLGMVQSSHYFIDSQNQLFIGIVIIWSYI